jgi:mTERF domain-containing protein
VSKEVSRELLSIGSRRSLDELYYSRINSASNPDAILALLPGAGLSRDDITAAVSADPLLLRAFMSTIAPPPSRTRHRVSLSTPQIVRFLLVASRSLRKGDVVSRLEFFISFYGSFEKALVAAKRNGSLLSISLERIEPNIALLHQ